MWPDTDLRERAAKINDWTEPRQGHTGHISLSAPLDSEAAAEWIELTALHLPEGIATSLLVSLF